MLTVMCSTILGSNTGVEDILFAIERGNGSGNDWQRFDPVYFGERS